MHRLQEAIGNWWHNYLAHLQPNAQLTWQQFKDAFRGFFIPEGAMLIKATKFCNLVQGKMPVVEYTHKFNELAQYTPNEVATDEAKKVRYEHGLNPMMQDKLCNVVTPTFDEMVNVAIKAETKKKVVDKDSRKREPYNTGYG